MLGARVAALRKAAGLSQSQLASQLNISSSAVGMYEQNRREPPLQIVAALAEFFGVSTDYLVTGKVINETEQQLISNLLIDRVNAADQQLQCRSDRPFSRQELAVLFAAMLMEP